MASHSNRRLISIACVLAILLCLLPAREAFSQAGDGCYTFEETRQTVCGRFLQYWREHGGVALFGYPVSEVVGETSDIDGNLYPTQYFERAQFELHLENAAPYDVLLSLLGSAHYNEKYPTGVPNEVPNIRPDSVLFKETGKHVGRRFFEFWQQHGGLAQFGLPITDEFTEISKIDQQAYNVQYFERAVFEFHPENQPPHDVQLQHLGKFRLTATEKLRPDLIAQFVAAGVRSGKVCYAVYMKEQADVENDIKDPQEKRAYVYYKLKELADRTQPPVRDVLEAHRKVGNVGHFVRIVIVNGFSAYGNLRSARAVAAMPEVAQLFTCTRGVPVGGS